MRKLLKKSYLVYIAHSKSDRIKARPSSQVHRWSAHSVAFVIVLCTYLVYYVLQTGLGRMKKFSKELTHQIIKPNT